MLTSQRARIVDMSNVGFLDTSTMGAPVDAMRSARENGGDVELAQVNPDARTLPGLTRLNRVFRTHALVDEVLRETGSSWNARMRTTAGPSVIKMDPVRALLCFGVRNAP